MKVLKLSKASRIFLSVGIFVVVVGSLGLTRSQQIKEQSQLDDELSIAEMRIENLGVKHLRQQQADLQEKLDKSQLQLTSAKDTLRQPVESIDVIDEFYAIAYSCGVEVFNISSSKIMSEELGEIVCSKITINATVKGELLNLIGFVISLNNDFTTGVVKSAKINIPPG